MTRRKAMVSALGAAAAASAAPSQAVKPVVLQPGDTVGLITPSSYVSDPDRLALAERTVRFFGLKPRFGENVRKRSGYLGGSVEERVRDLHAMFADAEVKAVFAIRGGYGAAQLLDRIDYDLIRRNPKIFLGYSDITALHLAIHQRTGMVTFHGPVAVSGFSEYTREHFRKALFDTAPLGALTNPPEKDLLRPGHTLRTIREGTARGTLVGGNLTLISTTMGTPFEIDTRDRILLLEDVDEQPYSVDRMLTQLRLAGKLEAAAGLVIGECSNCRPRDYQPSFESTFSLGEVLDNILGSLKIPVLTGLTFGHTSDQLTIPIGVMARLDAGKQELAVEEGATIPSKSATVTSKPR